MTQLCREVISREVIRVTGKAKQKLWDFMVFPSTWSNSVLPKVPRYRQDGEYGRARVIEALCYRDENVELLGWLSP